MASPLRKYRGKYPNRIATVAYRPFSRTLYVMTNARASFTFTHEQGIAMFGFDLPKLGDELDVPKAEALIEDTYQRERAERAAGWDASA